MRWRQRYMSRSRLIWALRLALGGITTAAPRASRSALSQSTSKALSPSRVPRRHPRSAALRQPGRVAGRATARNAPDCRVRRPGRRSWWSGRRANAQWPGLGSPPCATRLLVGGDDGAVDQGVFEVRLAGQAGEDALEYTTLHPAAEALEDAVPLAEGAGQIAPGRPPPHPP